jgi:hypothetical protein
MHSNHGHAVAVLLKLSLHWQSLPRKTSAISQCGYVYPILSLHLGWHGTDRIISICFDSPKVARASKEGNIASQYR